jgi:hypothetical protein
MSNIIQKQVINPTNGSRYWEREFFSVSKHLISLEDMDRIQKMVNQEVAKSKSMSLDET